MLAGIAEKISEKGMSLENVETHLRMNDNHREFVVDAYVSSKNVADRDNLLEIIKDISSIKGELSLDKLDIRVQSGKVDGKS